MFAALRNQVVLWSLLAVALGAGVAGWQVNGWRLSSAAARDKARADRAFAAELDKRLAAYRIKVTTLEAHSAELNTELEALRTAHSALQQEIDHVPLLPPPVGACAVRNPFSDDFVRLWNAAAAQRGEPR